jgi:hypothetical protein
MARYFTFTNIPIVLVETSLISPQPYVTELDLRHSLVPDEVIEDLLSTMPEHKGPDMQEDRETAKFDYITYMQRYMGADRTNGNGAEQVNGE